MQFFDTHCHLDDEQFATTLPEVLARACAAGVGEILAVATTAASSARCANLAAGHAGLWASAGIHPNYSHQAGPHDWDAVVALARDERVVALGETGLDKYWDDAPFAVQQDYFERHLRLAAETGLPFIVHMRNCQAEVLAMLAEAHAREAPLCGIMHAFSGTWETAQACLEMGLHISFAGMVTYKKSDDLRQIAARVPLERLLLETDAPYLSPEPLRSVRPNEPAHVVHTAACVAAARGMPLAELAAAATRNARQLLRRRG